MALDFEVQYRGVPQTDSFGIEHRDIAGYEPGVAGAWDNPRKIHTIDFDALGDQVNVSSANVPMSSLVDNTCNRLGNRCECLLSQRCHADSS